MPQPIAVKLAKPGSFAVSGPTLAVLVFLAFIAYVFFAGDGKPANTESARDPGGSHETISTPVTTGTGSSDTPTHTPRSSSRTREYEHSGGVDGPRSFSDNPDRWQDERYKPSTLRSIPSTPTAARSAVGWGKPSRTTNRVQIPARPEDEIVRTHVDDLMRGGGHQKEIDWKVWKAEANANNKWHPTPVELPEHQRRYRIKQDLSQCQAKSLFRGMTLAPGMFRRMCELELVARQDARGSPLGVAKWDAEGKALPSNAKSSLVDHMDDPTGESWDEVWGSLPDLALRSAEQVARVIRLEDINTLAKLMQARQKASKQDQLRDWNAFVHRAAPAMGGKLDQERLTIGWFADTYRSVAHHERMCISNQFVDMRKSLPLVVNCLQWLEAMACHLRRQRMFSPLGVDIHGLTLRLAVPCTVLSSQRDGARKYRYDLTLYVFMWGGPAKGGGEDGFKNWAHRLALSIDCLRSARTDLTQMLYDFNEPDYAINSLCKRRRVIFRPGYTAYGVNQSTFDTVDRTKALRGVVARDPLVQVYQENMWATIGDTVDRPIRELLTAVYPHEAGVLNSRQYQWNNSTLTEQNNKLHERHLLVILRALGPAMTKDPNFDEGGTMRLTHTIEFLDLGAFIPLVRTGDGVRFFPLDSMYALTSLVMPYSSSGRSATADATGATIRVLLDPSYGIRSQLASRRVSVGGERPTDERLKVCITVRNKSDADRLRWEITDYLQKAAREIIANAAPDGADKPTTNSARRAARQEIGGWIDKYISSVYIVDASRTEEASKLQGNLRAMKWERVQILGPDRWPSEFQDM